MYLVLGTLSINFFLVLIKSETFPLMNSSTSEVVFVTGDVNAVVARFGVSSVMVASLRSLLPAVICWLHNKMMVNIYKIRINAFSNDWKIYALVGLCNIAIPFSLTSVITATMYLLPCS